MALLGLFTASFIFEEGCQGEAREKAGGLGDQGTFGDCARRPQDQSPGGDYPE